MHSGSHSSGHGGSGSGSGIAPRFPSGVRRPIQPHEGATQLPFAHHHGASSSSQGGFHSSSSGNAAAASAAAAAAASSRANQAQPALSSSYGRSMAAGAGGSEDDRPVSASGRPTAGLAAYRLVKFIGRGKFGVCQLVESLATGKSYVMKQINLSEHSERERIAALQEVEALKRLQLPRPHPFIVRYHENFLWQDSLYIVMQHCKGGDLHQFLRARKATAPGVHLEEHTIIDWLIQLLLAIRKCHEAHIIHRDIKSQNIFLVPIVLPPGDASAAAAASAGTSEPRFTIKLGDWGISKILNSSTELALSVVGTPYSMSPEVCENKPYSFQSDIWAVGCVLYELCTLKHAFDSNNLLGLVWKIVQESYPPIPSMYSVDLQELLSAMLAKDPLARPTVEQMLDLKFIKRRLRVQIEEKLRARDGAAHHCRKRSSSSQNPHAASSSAAAAADHSSTGSRRHSESMGNVFDNGMSVTVAPSPQHDEEISSVQHSRYDDEPQSADSNSNDRASPRPLASGVGAGDSACSEDLRARDDTYLGQEHSYSRSAYPQSQSRSLQHSPSQGGAAANPLPFSSSSLASPSGPKRHSLTGTLGAQVIGKALLVHPAPVSAATGFSPKTLSPSNAQRHAQRGAGVGASPTNVGTRPRKSSHEDDGIETQELVRSVRLPKHSELHPHGTGSLRMHNSGGSGNPSPSPLRLSTAIPDTGDEEGFISQLNSPSHMSGADTSMVLLGGRSATSSLRGVGARRQSEKLISPSRPTAFGSPVGSSAANGVAGRARASTQLASSSSRSAQSPSSCGGFISPARDSTTYEISSPRTPGSFARMKRGGGAGTDGAVVTSSRTTVQLGSMADAKARRAAAQRIAKQDSFESVGGTDSDGDDEPKGEQESQQQQSPPQQQQHQQHPSPPQLHGPPSSSSKASSTAPKPRVSAHVRSGHHRGASGSPAELRSGDASPTRPDDEAGESGGPPDEADLEEALAIEQLQSQLGEEGDTDDEDSQIYVLPSSDDEDDEDGDDSEDDEEEESDPDNDPYEGEPQLPGMRATHRHDIHHQRMTVESFSAKRDPALSSLSGAHGASSTTSSAIPAAGAKKLHIHVTSASGSSSASTAAAAAPSATAADAGTLVLGGRHGLKLHSAGVVGSGGGVSGATPPSPRSPQSAQLLQPSLRSKFAAVKARCLRAMTPAAFDAIYRHFQSRHMLSPRPSLNQGAASSGSGAARNAFSYDSRPHSPAQTAGPTGASSTPLSPSPSEPEARNVRAVHELLRTGGFAAEIPAISADLIFRIEQLVYLQQVLDRPAGKPTLKSPDS